MSAILLLIFGVIASIASAGIAAGASASAAEKSNATQKQIADEQIAAQKDINQANIDMQRETNELQVAESEKAYQRSLVASQLQQFMDAGFSYEQAMRVVSGSSAGQYSPATLSSPVADSSGIISALSNYANNYQEPANATAQFTQQIASQIPNLIMDAGSRLVQGLESSDGGSIGALVSDHVVEQLTTHLDELTPEYRSLFGIMSLSKQDNCPEWLKTLSTSKEWKSCFNSFAGRKFVNSFFAQAYQFSANEYELSGMEIKNTQGRLNIARTKIQLSQDDANLRIAECNAISAHCQSMLDVNLHPYRIEAGIEQLKLQAEMSEIEYTKFNNPEYRQAWLRHMLLNEETGVLAATAYKARLTVQDEWLNEPGNAQFVGILELLDAANLTDSDWGSVLSTFIAGKNAAPAWMESLYDIVKKKLHK